MKRYRRDAQTQSTLWCLWDSKSTSLCLWVTECISLRHWDTKSTFLCQWDTCTSELLNTSLCHWHPEYLFVSVRHWVYIWVTEYLSVRETRYTLSYWVPLCQGDTECTSELLSTSLCHWHPEYLFVSVRHWVYIWVTEYLSVRETRSVPLTHWVPLCQWDTECTSELLSTSLCHWDTRSTSLCQCGTECTSELLSTLLCLWDTECTSELLSTSLCLKYERAALRLMRRVTVRPSRRHSAGCTDQFAAGPERTAPALLPSNIIIIIIIIISRPSTSIHTALAADHDQFVLVNVWDDDRHSNSSCTHTLCCTSLIAHCVSSIGQSVSQSMSHLAR